MTHAHGQFRSQDGATAVEYGIMVALVALAIVSAVFSLGTQLGDDYDCVETLVATTPQNPPAPC